MAHGTLFLRPVRQTVRRGRISRAGGTPVLQGRLLRHVRSQVRWMHPANNGELRVGPIHSVAFQLFRLQGKPWSPLKRYCITVFFFMFSVIRQLSLFVICVCVSVFLDIVSRSYRFTDAYYFHFKRAWHWTSKLQNSSLLFIRFIAV